MQRVAGFVGHFAGLRKSCAAADPGFLAQSLAAGEAARVTTVAASLVNQFFLSGPDGFNVFYKLPTGALVQLN